MEKIFYLAQVFDGLHTLMIIITSSLLIFWLIIVIRIFLGEFEDEPSEHMKKILTSSIFVLIFCALGFIFIPSKKTFLFMTGGRIVDSVVENKPEIKELPGNTFDLLNEYIKAETEKVKAKNEKDD